MTSQDFRERRDQVCRPAVGLNERSLAIANQEWILWQKFSVGVYFFFDFRPNHPDRDQILKLCRNDFERLLARGQGERLVYRDGQEVGCVAHYAHSVAASAAARVFRARRKALLPKERP